jgi:hypothetical protein
VHFYTTANNSRNKEQGIGGVKKYGQKVHCRTWSHGVKVVAENYSTQPGEPDSFAIYSTFGSNGQGKDEYLGEVVLKDGKPFFKAAEEWQK